MEWRFLSKALTIKKKSPLYDNPLDLVIKWILTKKKKEEKTETKFSNLRLKSFFKKRIFRLKAKFSPCKKEQKRLCIKKYIYSLLYIT